MITTTKNAFKDLEKWGLSKKEIGKIILYPEFIFDLPYRLEAFPLGNKYALAFVEFYKWNDKLFVHLNNLSAIESKVRALKRKIEKYIKQSIKDDIVLPVPEETCESWTREKEFERIMNDAYPNL